MALMVVEKYPKTNKALTAFMKIVQRELPDGKLKVEVLSVLVDVKEKLDNDGKEPSGQG